MSLDVEYAIKKDIRNNPVVREVDRQHKQQLMRTVLLTVTVVVMLLFWAWQRFGIVEDNYAASTLRAEILLEQEKNRQFQLEVDMLRAPRLIETKATHDLHMVAPTAATTLVLDPSEAPVRPTTVIK